MLIFSMYFARGRHLVCILFRGCYAIGWLCETEAPSSPVESLTKVHQSSLNCQVMFGNLFKTKEDSRSNSLLKLYINIYSNLGDRSD